MANLKPFFRNFANMMSLPPQTRRRPPFLPFAMFAGGLAACLYFGQQWYELPAYSPTDIQASAELNLKLDLQQRGPNQPPLSEAEIERMRSGLQQEVASEINAERQHVVQYFGLGLVAVVLGFGQLLMAWLLRRKKAA